MDKRRRLFWLVFLGVAVVVALIPEFFEQEPDEWVVESARRPARGPLEQLRSTGAPPATDPQPAPALALLGSSRSESLRADIFAPHSWYVPPPAQPAPPPRPAPPPPPAPPPSAPPLPFEFFGKLDDSERLRVFLSRGDRVYTVGVGDVIDGTYRVQSIGGTEMVLVYLPLNISQTLSVGSNL